MQGHAVLGVDGNWKELQSSEIPCQHESQPILWEQIERVIVSPGIHPRHPIYQAALSRGIDIIGEAELALPHFKKPMVAITGTNGKTTVTLLIEHALNFVGIKAKALGNVGIALCDYLLEPGPEEAFVIELSSFQLETMRTPVFDAAAILNITADHLDRYEDMQDYARAKWRLQHLLKEDGMLFVQKETLEEFSHLRQIENYQKIELIMPTHYTGNDLMAKHDIENASAAWGLCGCFSITSEQFGKALETFQKPPHRIEFVRELNGIQFFDDSKGTNIDAVIQAVCAMKGDVILIAGGVDKGASYLPWVESFAGKVKQIIVIGEAAPKIYGELHNHFNVKIADSLASAVQDAANVAKKGDTVLLSPGCSSFDMFRSYAHRGKEFQRYVQSLK